MSYLHACILYIPVEYSLIPRLIEPRDENLHLYDHYCVYCPHKIMCMYMYKVLPSIRKVYQPNEPLV